MCCPFGSFCLDIIPHLKRVTYQKNMKHIFRTCVFFLNEMVTSKFHQNQFSFIHFIVTPSLCILRIIICCNTLLVHLISSVSAAFIFCHIYSEKRRLSHTRVRLIRMLTSMRLHSIRMLTSIRLHLIRMLPHISLCSICLLSFTHHRAANNSSCICFPNSLSLPPCN